MSFAQRSLQPLLPRGSSTRPPEPRPASYRCIRQGRSGQGDQDCPSSMCSLRLGQCIPQPHPGCDCVVIVKGLGNFVKIQLFDLNHHKLAAGVAFRSEPGNILGGISTENVQQRKEQGGTIFLGKSVQT